MKRLFKNIPTILVTIALATALLPSCCTTDRNSNLTTTNVKPLLQDIETYIDARPDSALVTLQAIPNKSIHGKSTKAYQAQTIR